MKIKLYEKNEIGKGRKMKLQLSRLFDVDQATILTDVTLIIELL